MSSTRSRRLASVPLVVALLASIALAPAAQGKDKRDLTVMSRNLYLGADIAQVLGATSQLHFLMLVKATYETVQDTDFPARAVALADEIDTNDVDIIGLQEVSRWTTAGSAAPPSFDFLQILLDELAERGLSYSVAAISHNLNVPNVPLMCPALPPTCLVSYEDRDVILVNDDTPGLKVTSGRDGRYVAQQTVSLLGSPLSFNRGWTAIDGTLDGKRFRFAQTHLEIHDFAAVQEAQGREFLAGPGTAEGAVIAVGDFNSNVDGSTTSTYGELTDEWFADAWALNPSDPGLSCCQHEDLSNTVSELQSRIDLVLTHGPVRPQEVHVVGTTTFQGLPPRWPSDHAGVVATLRLH